MKKKLLAVIVATLIVAALLSVAAYFYLMQQATEYAPISGFAGIVGSSSTVAVLSVILVALISAAFTMGSRRYIFETAG